MQWFSSVTMFLRDLGEIPAACGPSQPLSPRSSLADRSRAALALLNSCTDRASGAFARSCTRAAWCWSFSSPSCQNGAIATDALPRVAIRLLRSFSATFARALSAAALLIWSFTGGGALDRVALGTSSRGNPGRQNTNRCETCGQAEHLNVWRSNATSDAGSPRWSTCIRRISGAAGQALHRSSCP